VITDSGVTFRPWAPATKTVAVLLDRPYAMTRPDGWFATLVPCAKEGTRYRFRIDDKFECRTSLSVEAFHARLDERAHQAPHE
jgi:1,4-alpha-glucan branching enzyme